MTYLSRFQQWLKRPGELKWLIGLVLLLLPTYWLIFKPGLWSMHDFHIFRQYQYNRCIDDMQIPCRWSPDATFEYGQPVFNFYGQLPYAFGQVVRPFHASITDTVKFLFLSSILLSALSMYLLARQLWQNHWAAITVAVVYSYAPYRALDIYVRGALPESMGFIFFPLIIYLFNRYLNQSNSINLILFSLSLAGLSLTHNLSAMMFSFVLAVWMIWRLGQSNQWLLIPKLILAGVLAFGVASYYLLPLVVESQFTGVDQIASGFYSYTNHFSTINQLFISNFWGFGGSPKDLSLSVGYIQWLAPIITVLILAVKRRWNLLVLAGLWAVLGLWAVWMTHNKSLAVWQLISPLGYLQFPWRFLGVAVFCLAISIGGLVAVWPALRWQKLIAGIIIILVVLINTPFYRYDLWFDKSDMELFSGDSYQQLISSSATDYYPNYGTKVPTQQAPDNPMVEEGTGSAKLLEQDSQSLDFKVEVLSETAKVIVPVAYFPGWVAHQSGQSVHLYPSGDYGLITMDMPKGNHQIRLDFENTFIRSIANLISGISIIGCLVGLWYFSRKAKQHG